LVLVVPTVGDPGVPALVPEPGVSTPVLEGAALPAVLVFPPICAWLGLLKMAGAKRTAAIIFVFILLAAFITHLPKNI
jgi:hypothetical protein